MAVVLLTRLILLYCMWLTKMHKLKTKVLLIRLILLYCMWLTKMHKLKTKSWTFTTYTYRMRRIKENEHLGLT